MARLGQVPGHQQAPLWLELAAAALELGRVAQAIKALTSAIACGAGARAEADLAVLHALRGEPLRAAAELQEILARDPACHEARVHLASLLLAEGREASVLALLAPPVPTGVIGARWRAQRSFALLRRREAKAARAAVPAQAGDILVTLQHLRLALADGDGPAVKRSAAELAALADDPKRARLEDRIEAHFQLGSLLHAERRPEPALSHWQRGHLLLAGAQPFSRAHHAALLSSVQAAFGETRFARGPDSGRADPAPVFIVGLPRSGTTLAEHILSAHADIHGAGERMALLETVANLAGSVLDPATPGRAAALDDSVLASAADRYLAALRASAPDGARRIIDKMPANDMQLGFAAILLPGARIIHCTRDPRATGFSIFRRRLSGYHPYAHDLADLGWWMRAQRTLMAHWRAVLPIPMIEVDLDDWTRDFKATLARVLEFLGLPYDAACESFHLQERDIHTASRDQVRRPVSAGARERREPYAALLAPMFDELRLDP